MNEIKPKFVHDCEACRFVGRLDGMDAYIHDHPEHKGSGTLILRNSSEGSDYLSMPKEMAERVRPDDARWHILLRMAAP